MSVENTDSLILYGMMGAGKSTLGHGLSEQLSYDFADTDGIVEAYAKMTCAELVANPNLDFACYQQTAILQFIPEVPTVIATGGSVAMYPRITKHLGTFGTGVFIKVDPDVLEARLPEERIKALNNPKGLSFADLYTERMPKYEQVVDLTIEVGDEPSDVTLARLIDILGL